MTPQLRERRRAGAACSRRSPDVAFISLEYGDGVISHVELSWLAPSKLRRTTIVGSKKMLVYDDTSNEPVRVFDSGVHLRPPETFGEYNLTYRSGDILSPHVPAAEPLLLEMGDFCEADPHRTAAAVLARAGGRGGAHDRGGGLFAGRARRADRPAAAHAGCGRVSAATRQPPGPSRGRAEPRRYLVRPVARREVLLHAADVGQLARVTVRVALEPRSQRKPLVERVVGSVAP